MNQLIEKLDTQDGYDILPRIEENEYNFIRESIEKQWLKKITDFDSALSKKIEEEKIDIQNYHKISEYLPHSQLWGKRSRIFDVNTARNFVNLSFIENLKKMIGEFTISDEENLGFENIYWRLVRPEPFVDIGGMHRDEWFWEINNQYKKPSYPYYRRKIWIPIYSEMGQNGLLVVPYSQLDEKIEWKSLNVGDAYKPRIISEINNEDIKHLRAENGEVIVFHDRLLHGGSKNRGKRCRISVEFTAIIRE